MTDDTNIEFDAEGRRRRTSPGLRPRFHRRLPSRRTLIGLLCVCWTLATASALAGGGVMLKNDRCVMTIGFYEAHFTAYQPDSRGDEEFCEDLPDLGRVVFVLDYLHRSLAEVPVDFRIIRDPTGLGRFAQLADLEGVDIPALTVFYQPPVVRSDASLQLSYRFAEPGAYIGIVTAGHPTKDKFYSSVFPFSVGVGGPSYLWIVGAVGALLVAGGGVWLLRRPAAGRPGVVV